MMVAELVRYTDDGMGLDEAIAAYLAACEVEGESPRTGQAYRETLSRFRRICAAEGLPARVAAFRPADVYRFLKTITDSGVSLGTRHRRFRETRAFFSWCTRMGVCVRNPFTGSVRSQTTKGVQRGAPRDRRSLRGGHLRHQ